MRLSADFTLARGPHGIEVSLACDDAATLALVGPNGAGKSSCLRAIAGLVAIDRGRIELDARCLDAGTAASFVPAEERAVGYVPQETLLFPHLCTLDNVAYGLRARGASRRDARREAASWLERVALAGLGAKRPGELSGGQAQRVALARAPRVSPAGLVARRGALGARRLDSARAAPELREHLDAFEGVRIVVAHDVVDALALGDRLAVIEDGRIVQQGDVQAVCEEPRSPYVADLVGINLWKGTAHAGCLELDAGGQLAAATRLTGEVFATIHPRAVALYRSRPDGSPRNVWRATVASIEDAGERVRVRLHASVDLVAELTPAARRELALEPGGEIWVAIKATEVAVYPR